MTLNIIAALRDPTRFLDVFPMGPSLDGAENSFEYTDDADRVTYYNYLVRSTESDITYCEIDDVSPNNAEAVEAMLNEIYCLNNIDSCLVSSKPTEEIDPFKLSGRSISIAAINDRFRASFDTRLGKVVLTPNVADLKKSHLRELLFMIKGKPVRADDNDPYNEHDFGSIDAFGNKFFWKIDYYDKNCEYGSEDPVDINITCRVMTVMFASDY